jgi:hypothetical protein
MFDTNYVCEHASNIRMPRPTRTATCQRYPAIIIKKQKLFTDHPKTVDMLKALDLEI